MKKADFTPEQKMFLASINESMEEIAEIFKKVNLKLELVITQIKEESLGDEDSRLFRRKPRSVV